MRVSVANRDMLAEIAENELGGVSLDEALRVVIFEHRTRAALARMANDSTAADDYFSEAQELAETDVEVRE